MTQRERQPSAGATLAPRPAPAPPRAGAAHAGEPTVPPWEDLFRSVPPAQQSELLALAVQQGLLYAHQLPTSDPTVLNQRRALLSQLLAGKTELVPVSSRPVEVIDRDLDAAQREAVARALHSPDVCLLQGFPGSGKSRVIAEVVTQAAARGERVLLLSPTPAALDRVLEFASRREVLCPVRCVGRDERPETLADWVRPFTFEERVRGLRETVMQAARADAQAARAHLDRLRAGLPAWDELDRLASCQEVLDGKLANVARRRERLAEDIQHAWEAALATPSEDAADTPQAQFGERVRACRREHNQGLERIEADRAKWRAREEELGKKSRQLHQEIEAERPVVDARQGGRWWTPAWWRGLFRGDLVVRHGERLSRLQGIGQEEAALKGRAEKLEADRVRCEERFEQKRRDLLEVEADRRRLELDREEAELRLEADLLRRQWNEARTALGDRAPADDAPTAAAAAGRTDWLAELAREESNSAFASRWADCLEEAAPTFPARLTACTNLVAATTAWLAADPHFGESASTPPITFDLLVLDEADRVTEAELLNVSRRARRWVLVGEPAAPPPAAVSRPGGRSPRGSSLKPGIFQRLWDRLHCIPSRLPFAWVKGRDQLRCRLRPVAPEQQQWVESEPVADRPEVELRILVPPHGEPALVEVCFPPETAIREAKEFIFKELQEVPAHCLGYALTWQEDRATIRLQFSGEDGWDQAPDVTPVPLDDGVQEFVRLGSPAQGEGVPFETLGYVFDRGAGWVRERAEEWVNQRLGLRDLGRTAFLGRLRRPWCGLAAFVADVLFRDREHAPPRPLPSPPVATGGDPCGGAWGKWTSAVEFIAVPPSEPRRRGGRHGDGHAGRGRPPRGGAGYELDLTDNTHPEHVPASLRPALPGRGLVNYFEAQAVVQTLETLLSDPGFRADAAAWQGCPTSHSDQNGQAPRQEQAAPAPHSPVVVVTALYSAQVQLLRLLVGQSPVLAQAGLEHVAEGQFRLALPEGMIEVHVTGPDALRQRECLALVLSLTRSHTHRAVALGEDPDWLPLTLTRPRGRLFLFGDVGTLARRAQWLGAVDHLDDVAAGREREVVLRLLDHLEGRGPAERWGAGEVVKGGPMPPPLTSSPPHHPTPSPGSP